MFQRGDDVCQLSGIIVAGLLRSRQRIAGCSAAAGCRRLCQSIGAGPVALPHVRLLVGAPAGVRLQIVAEGLLIHNAVQQLLVAVLVGVAEGSVIGNLIQQFLVFVLVCVIEGAVVLDLVHQIVDLGAVAAGVCAVGAQGTGVVDAVAFSQLVGRFGGQQLLLRCGRIAVVFQQTKQAQAELRVPLSNLQILLRELVHQPGRVGSGNKIVVRISHRLIPPCFASELGSGVILPD